MTTIIICATVLLIVLMILLYKREQNTYVNEPAELFDVIIHKEKVDNTSEEMRVTFTFIFVHKYNGMVYTHDVVYFYYPDEDIKSFSSKLFSK